MDIWKCHHFDDAGSSEQGSCNTDRSDSHGNTVSGGTVRFGSIATAGAVGGVVEYNSSWCWWGGAWCDIWLTTFVVLVVEWPCEAIGTLITSCDCDSTCLTTFTFVSIIEKSPGDGLVGIAREFDGIGTIGEL